MSEQPDDSAAALDETRARELLELAGREELDQIFGLFFEDAARRISVLEVAWRASDPEALRRVAHALKGAALNVGASRFARLAEQLEHGEAVEGDPADRLRRELEDVKAALIALG